MKAALVLLLLVCVSASVALANVEYAVTDDIVNTINNTPGITWKAAHNRFSFWTVEEVKRILGTQVAPPQEEKAFALPPAGYKSSVPDNFDSRTEWPNCVHPIRDQAQCGSCWAFSASEVVSDRLCIATNGTTNVVMSPQYLVSCDQSDMGCDGGNLANVWGWITSHGIVSDACMPYTAGGGDSGTCTGACTAAGQAYKFYKSKSYAHLGSWLIFWKRVEQIQTAIQQGGPVQAGFTVYQDFMSYSSGVYKHSSGGVLGGHAVKIVGWGVSNGTPYWIVANSWGTSWGQNGYFWIIRGDDNCGFESGVYTGEF